MKLSTCPTGSLAVYVVVHEAFITTDPTSPFTSPEYVVAIVALVSPKLADAFAETITSVGSFPTRNERGE